MRARSGKAYEAVCAGTALALALGAVTSPVALAATGVSDDPVVGEYASPEYDDQLTATSHGETKLYVIAQSDDLATAEGAANEQLKVSIPVAIHYVAKTDGSLVGPNDNVVKFVNHTRLGAVHVSKIAVTNGEKATIAKATGVNGANDTLSLSMTPTTGTSDDAGSVFAAVGAAGTEDELGNYVVASVTAGIDPVNKNEWDIAQKNGAKALNGLTGTIGGFDKIDPSSDTQVGTVHWTIRSGTRAQADVRDDTLTIHYNANDGSNKGCVPVGDQPVRISSGGNDALAGASTVAMPHAVYNADGTVTEYEFTGWNTQADGRGTTVRKPSDIPNFSTLGNKTFELFATYAEKTA